MRFYKTLPDFERRKQLSIWHKALKVDWSPKDIDYEAKRGLDSAQARRHLARALSPILMGEQAGLYSITNIIPKLLKTGEVEAQLFLTSMCLDEAKHLEVLSRYYHRLDEKPLKIRECQPSFLFQAAINSDDPVVWLTGSLISEVIAKQSLESVRDLHVDPVLDDICDRVLEDESRHLGFNHVFLADRFAVAHSKGAADAAEIAENLEAQLELVLDKVPAILKQLQPDTDALGMESPDDFFDRLRFDCRRRLQRSVDAGQRDWEGASIADAVEEDA